MKVQILRIITFTGYNLICDGEFFINLDLESKMEKEKKNKIFSCGILNQEMQNIEKKYRNIMRVEYE